MESIIKKRRIAVQGGRDGLNDDKIKDELERNDGIITIDVDQIKGRIDVAYDLRKIDFEKIESFLEELGIDLSKKIRERLKRGLAKFTEQNELDNFKAKPSSCCEDPNKSCHRASR